MEVRWRGMRRLVALGTLVTLFAGACSSTPSPIKAAASAKPSVRSLPGGCAGTVLTDAIPPRWAQGGWHVANAQRWPVPWAMASSGDALAFMWATQLVAGSSPRADGTNNKVLWVVNGTPDRFVVEGRPLGKARPEVTLPGGPSIVDVPSAGCWTFRLTWGDSPPEHVSTINLQVMPAGTVPSSAP